MTPEQFEEITKWQDETFPKATTISKLIHLAGKEPEGEVGELIRAINDEDHTIDQEKIRAIKMEYADCFLLLFGSAAKYGLKYQDIIDAIQRKFEINKSRKWGQPNEHGVSNHIKE